MIVLYIHGHEYIAYIHGHEYTSNIQFVYCNLLYIMEVHNIPGILRSRHLQNAINISWYIAVSMIYQWYITMTWYIICKFIIHEYTKLVYCWPSGIFIVYYESCIWWFHQNTNFSWIYGNVCILIVYSLYITSVVYSLYIDLCCILTSFL